MLSWNYLSKFSLQNPPLENFSRDAITEKQYNLFKDTMKKNNISLNNHIINKYFSDNSKYKLLLNKYPYYTEEDIVHYVLWINPKFNSEFNNEKVINILDDNFNDYIVFKNLTKNMSIEGVVHYQVFTKNKKKIEN